MFFEENSIFNVHIINSTNMMMNNQLPHPPYHSGQSTPIQTGVVFIPQQNSVMGYGFKQQAKTVQQSPVKGSGGGGSYFNQSMKKQQLLRMPNNHVPNNLSVKYRHYNGSTQTHRFLQSSGGQQFQSNGNFHSSKQSPFPATGFPNHASLKKHNCLSRQNQSQCALPSSLQVDLHNDMLKKTGLGMRRNSQSRPSLLYNASQQDIGVNRRAESAHGNISCAHQANHRRNQSMQNLGQHQVQLPQQFAVLEEDFVKAFAVPGFIQETAREYDCEVSTPTEASLYNPLTGVKQQQPQVDNNLSQNHSNSVQALDQSNIERQIQDLVAQVKRLEKLHDEKFNNLLKNQIISPPIQDEQTNRMPPRRVSLSIQELEKAIQKQKLANQSIEEDSSSSASHTFLPPQVVEDLDQTQISIQPGVNQIPVAQTNTFFLPPQTEKNKGKKTLILDLDETLIHSSFEPLAHADFISDLQIEPPQSQSPRSNSPAPSTQVFVVKRPFCEEFIYRVSEWYEVVMFTASIAEYAEPLYHRIDRHRVTSAHLYRQQCTFHNGLYVKDLSKLGRSLSDIIIVDNSPLSSLFQPENALPCSSWYEDKNDRELLHLLPILEKLSIVQDVRIIIPKLKDEEGEKVFFDVARDFLGIPEPGQNTARRSPSPMLTKSNSKVQLLNPSNSQQNLNSQRVSVGQQKQHQQVQVIEQDIVNISAPVLQGQQKLKMLQTKIKEKLLPIRIQQRPITAEPLVQNAHQNAAPRSVNTKCFQTLDSVTHQQQSFSTILQSTDQRALTAVNNNINSLENTAIQVLGIETQPSNMIRGKHHQRAQTALISNHHQRVVPYLELNQPLMQQTQQPLIIQQQPSEQRDWVSINHHTERQSNFNSIQNDFNANGTRSISGESNKCGQRQLYQLIGHQNPRSTSGNNRNVFQLGPPSPDPKQRMTQQEPQTPYLNDGAQQTAAFNFSQLTPTVASIKKQQSLYNQHHQQDNPRFNQQNVNFQPHFGNFDQSLSLLQDSQQIRFSHASLNFDLSAIPKQPSRQQNITQLQQSTLIHPSSFESSIKEIPHFSLNKPQQNNPLQQFNQPQQPSKLLTRLETLCKKNIVVEVNNSAKPIISRKLNPNISENHQVQQRINDQYSQRNLLHQPPMVMKDVTNRHLDIQTHRPIMQQKVNISAQSSQYFNPVMDISSMPVSTTSNQGNFNARRYSGQSQQQAQPQQLMFQQMKHNQSYYQ